MTHEEIIFKINELKIKLNFNQKKRVGKKIKLIGVQSHLRKYYNEELTKLTKLENEIGKQRTQKISFTWDNIIFDDYKIHLYQANNFHGTIQLINSRKSFAILKSYLLKLNLKPIICKIRGNEIIEVENIKEIFEIIQVFEIKKMISNFSKYKTTDFEKAIEKLNNKTTISIKRTFEKSAYFNFLVGCNDIKYKIIPLLENGDAEDDSFIFTIKNNKNIYLVWESYMENKATYIFSTTINNYFQHVYDIVQFILSKKTTRMDLRQNFIYENNFDIKSSFIYHSNFIDWKSKFEKLCF